MLFKKLAAGSVAALALMSAGATSAQDPSFGYPQTMQCFALFYTYAEMQSDAETKEVLEVAAGLMLAHAQRLPAAANKSQEDVFADGRVELSRLQAQIDATSQSAEDVVVGYGPGLDRCIDAVMEESANYE